MHSSEDGRRIPSSEDQFSCGRRSSADNLSTPSSSNSDFVDADSELFTATRKTKIPSARLCTTVSWCEASSKHHATVLDSVRQESRDRKQLDLSTAKRNPEVPDAQHSTENDTHRQERFLVKIQEQSSECAGENG